MVSFSHTSYYAAIQCQKAQDRLLEKIQSRGNFEQNIEQASFCEELNQWMKQYSDEVADLLK